MNRSDLNHLAQVVKSTNIFQCLIFQKKSFVENEKFCQNQHRLESKEEGSLCLIFTPFHCIGALFFSMKNLIWKKIIFSDLIWFFFNGNLCICQISLMNQLFFPTEEEHFHKLNYPFNSFDHIVVFMLNPHLFAHVKW